MKLGILTSHPTQYQVPLFRELARRKDVSLRVYFCHDHGVRPTPDPGFGRTIAFDIPLLEGYEHEFLPNISPRPRLAPLGLINPSIVRIVARGEVDALVVHGYSTFTTLSAILTSPRSTRILLRGDSNVMNDPPFLKKVVKQVALRALFRHVDAFLTTGKANRDYYLSYGVPSSKLAFAPFCVDNSFFASRSAQARADPSNTRARFGLPEAGPLFLFAGKLIPKKRPMDVILAHRKALNVGPCALAVVGDGELRSALESEVARLGLRATVRLLGFLNQSELPAAYGAADALILPSEIEPWGLVVNEAAASGATAIVSDQVGSWPDLVEAENVFRCGDVDGIASIMARYILSPALLEASKLASIRRIAAWGIPQSVDGILSGAQLAIDRGT